VILGMLFLVLLQRLPVTQSINGAVIKAVQGFVILSELNRNHSFWLRLLDVTIGQNT
jgi:hypothetical protein